VPLKEIDGQFFHLDGWKPQKWDSRDKFLFTSPAQIAMLPRRVDLRPLYDLKVENQRDLGSCTGESVTSALEAALVASSLASDNPPAHVQLSPLWLYAKSRLYEGTPLTEDSGCALRDVIKVAAKQGCALESSWPYDPEKYDVVPPGALDFEAAYYKALFYFACGSDFAAMASLAQTFPVVFGMDIYDSQLTAESMATGRISKALDGEVRSGGHAMLKVGYDMDMEIGAGTAQAHKGAWLVLNSWGEDVGEGGYFWVSFACRTRDCWTVRRTG
jgi:C1A family cysteine protease